MNTNIYPHETYDQIERQCCINIYVFIYIFIHTYTYIYMCYLCIYITYLHEMYDQIERQYYLNTCVSRQPSAYSRGQ
jgi:hypothetical protein